MRLALVFLIPAVVVVGGILLLRLWIGTTAAVLVVGLAGMGLQVYGLVSLRRKASAATADVTIETLDPVRLEEFRRAFLLSRPPTPRRLLTLGMGGALPVSLVVAWLANGLVEEIVGALLFPLMIGLASRASSKTRKIGSSWKRTRSFTGDIRDGERKVPFRRKSFFIGGLKAGIG